MNTYTRGIYYKLYTILDIYSRKIVGWEEETGELASELVERAMLLEKVKFKGNKKPLVLHSDNGAPMKSHTLKSKLEMLGVLSPSIFYSYSCFTNGLFTIPFFKRYYFLKFN